MDTDREIDTGFKYIKGYVDPYKFGLSVRRIPLSDIFRRRLTPEGGLPPPPILMRVDGRYGATWEALIKEVHHYGAMLIQRWWRNR